MEIEHVALVNNWSEIAEINNPKTLILGSFNPFNPSGNNTDFYYGRSSNYFWKIIANKINENDEYFCGNIERKIEIMKKFRFCFFDVINSLSIECDDENILRAYVNDNIFNNYLDSKIFTSTHRKTAKPIQIKRNYNTKIVDFLNENQGINIIHTMGKNRIDLNLKTNPIKDGFQNLITSIDKTSQIKKESYSPSGYAVKTGGANHLINLKNWIESNVIL